MPATVNSNILMQKVRQGNRLRDVSSVSPSRALRLVLARVAEEMWGLGAVSQGIQMDVLDQETALSVLAGDQLILVLSSDTGDVGLALLSRSALTALIEVQTVGSVFDRPPEDRPYTTTDALMAWVYLDRVFAAFRKLLGDSPFAAQVQGFRFETRAEDLRTAGLFLNSSQYHILTATVDFGPGLRTGDIQLVLPLRAAPSGPERQRTTGSADGAATGFDSLPANLRVVLCRLSLPLSRACGLQPGELLTLPPDSLSKAELLTVQGKTVARGKLGQINGMRAIRLALPNPPPKPDTPAPSEEGTGDAQPQAMPNPESLLPDPAFDGGANLPDLPTLSDLPDLEDGGDSPEWAGTPISDASESEDLSDLVGLEDFPDWDAAALEDQ